MVLTIDIGNTNACFAGVELSQDYPVIFFIELPTKQEWTMYQYADALKERYPKDCTFQGAILSSVVPSVIESIQGALMLLFGQKAMVVSENMDLGIGIDVLEPSKVGKDRLVDAAWAAYRYGTPVITVDLGTASTFNAVNRDGNFCGGVIAAGIQTGLLALYGRTAQLPQLSLKMPDQVIGRNTEQCMMSGAVYGTAGLVDGILSAMSAQLADHPTVVLTGGGARYVMDLLTTPFVLEQDMMHKGLAYLYQKNFQ